METRKRIRLHELRMGMFVEELDNQPRSADGPFRPFLISTPAQIAWLMRANVISVVINVQKGLDLQHSTPQPGDFDRQAVEASLLAHFSPKDLEAARHSIAETKPDIRNVLTEARISGGFAARSATTAVERIMSAAMDNAGALIGVAKLKANDEVTYLHSLAVSALMIAFGRNLGLDEDGVRLLGIGGLVHDLGKMTLPPAILMKTGKLTTEEMGIMRTHTQRGYQVLSSIDTTPQEVLDICLFHHEKFDGTGYPRRLIGMQIPYFARIAAICEDFAQLRQTYGDNRAETLMNNFSNKLVLRTTDGIAAEQLSKYLGDREMHEEQVSFSTSGGGSFSYSPSIITERLVLPSEIQKLPDLEGYLNFAGDWPVIKVKVPLPAQ